MRQPRIFPEARESGRVVLTVGANLDFDLAEPVNPHLPRGNRARRGSDSAVMAPL